MYHDCFSNFARRNCAFFSDAVPVHRVVRAAEFKMATGCKFLSLAASREKEKYRIALTTTRDIRNLVNNAFENAIKDFSTEKGQLKETLMKLEKKLR